MACRRWRRWRCRLPDLTQRGTFTKLYFFAKLPGSPSSALMVGMCPYPRRAHAACYRKENWGTSPLQEQRASGSESKSGESKRSPPFLSGMFLRSCATVQRMLGIGRAPWPRAEARTLRDFRGSWTWRRGTVARTDPHPTKPKSGPGNMSKNSISARNLCTVSAATVGKLALDKTHHIPIINDGKSNPVPCSRRRVWLQLRSIGP